MGLKLCLEMKKLWNIDKIFKVSLWQKSQTFFLNATFVLTMTRQHLSRLSFGRIQVSQSNPLGTKVESSLLQIDPTLCWNFSQTILNFFFWHILFWLVLFLVVCHCLLFCFNFFQKISGKSSSYELGQFEVNLSRL